MQHTDFILAVIAEEWGFLGVISCWASSPRFCCDRLTLARVARDRGGVFLILALCGMMFFSVMVNASMMIGLLPTTGIPLPLVSYGGSSIATTLHRDRADSGRGLPALRQRVRSELLVNATPPETRVALTEDGRTVEVLHERRGHQGLVGNVYLARVHRVLPGMNAAFVSLGLERDALPLRRGHRTPERRGRRRGDRDTGPRLPAAGGPSESDRIDDLLEKARTSSSR